MNSMTHSSPAPPPRPVMTVQGPVPYEALGITDAHNHAWISLVQGVSPAAPVLDRFDAILDELVEYRNAGGRSLLDCQPPGCGRDAHQLLALSIRSGVHIIACTGFHRSKYYPPDYWMWKADAEKTADFICSELQRGLMETLDTAQPIRAGFVKIALETTWSTCPQAALEGAAAAALRSRTLMEIHTEKGALAEKACIYFMDHGLLPGQLVLCHMDKRPDLVLHKELARLGVLLEYDTFYRPKYNPAANLWPLLEKMVNAGFADRVALATDMAEAELYRHLGGGPGLASLPGEIHTQLIAKGIPDAAQQQLLGGNIARRLAGLH